MINNNIKKLIKEVENLLKKDDRFIDNDDNTYKQHIKKLYKDSKCKNNSIDLTGLFNNMQQINTYQPHPIPVNTKAQVDNELNFDELDRAINALDMERLFKQSYELHRQTDAIMGKSTVR